MICAPKSHTISEQLTKKILQRKQLLSFLRPFLDGPGVDLEHLVLAG